MSIQALNNSASLTYSPPVTNRPAAEASPSRLSPEPASNSRVEKKEEAQSVKPADQKKSLQQATEKANHLVVSLNSDLKFSVDEDTGINVVKVIDTKTKEVIRQIPAQEMLDMAKHLDDLQGLLIKEQA